MAVATLIIVLSEKTLNRPRGNGIAEALPKKGGSSAEFVGEERPFGERSVVVERMLTVPGLIVALS